MMGREAGVARLLADASSEARAKLERDPALASSFVALLEAGRTRYPDVPSDDVTFAALLAAKLPAGGWTTLREVAVDAAELYLACGCEAGDARALAHFERTYFPVVAAALAPMKLPAGSVDEVRQIVRTKLLVAEDGAPPKLRQYAGLGSLEGLVRVVAVRIALNLVRQSKKDIPIDTNVADEILAIGVSPELQLVKQRYRDHFKHAFATAIEELSARERTVLKLHLVDRLSIDDIGALYKVHRATAARWLEAIRDKLGERTKALLGAQLALDTTELDSVVRAVHSQITFSLAPLLDKR